MPYEPPQRNSVFGEISNALSKIQISWDPQHRFFSTYQNKLPNRLIFHRLPPPLRGPHWRSFGGGGAMGGTCATYFWFPNFILLYEFYSNISKITPNSLALLENKENHSKIIAFALKWWQFIWNYDFYSKRRKTNPK